MNYRVFLVLFLCFLSGLNDTKAESFPPEFPSSYAKKKHRELVQIVRESQFIQRFNEIDNAFRIGEPQSGVIYQLGEHLQDERGYVYEIRLVHPKGRFGPWILMRFTITSPLPFPYRGKVLIRMKSDMVYFTDYSDMK